jgi:hypothetical protein
LGPIVGKVQARDVLKKIIDGYNIALFIFAVFFTVFLDGVIGELHENLLFIASIWIVFLIYFGAGSHVPLFIEVAFPVK